MSMCTKLHMIPAGRDKIFGNSEARGGEERQVGLTVLEVTFQPEAGRRQRAL